MGRYPKGRGARRSRRSGPPGRLELSEKGEGTGAKIRPDMHSRGTPEAVLDERPPLRWRALISEVCALSKG
jgi:hypothetical protein